MTDIKYNLAAAYRIMAYLAMDDHTYTHLSARPLNADFYYIYPFGLRFEEVTRDNLLKVSLEGKVLEGSEYQYNKTGYFIHGNIYKARSDISAIFHFHTPASVAVSSMQYGLLPISQWALHFYERVSYHNYGSLVLNNNQSAALVNDLGQNYVMFLRNHGVITCGKTIHETMFYSYNLEQACKTQCLAHRGGQELITPSKEVCRQTLQDILSFEKDLGRRDWEAWLRCIDFKTVKKQSSMKRCCMDQIFGVIPAFAGRHCCMDRFYTLCHSLERGNLLNNITTLIS